MLTMTDESRAFLEKNCPAVLSANNLSDALDALFEDIEEKGFGGEHFDEYNDYARAAQRVYDDLYRSNKRRHASQSEEL